MQILNEVSADAKSVDEAGNNLTVDINIMKDSLMQYNFKDMCCGEFFAYLKANNTLLKKIRSSEKYL